MSHPVLLLYKLDIVAREGMDWPKVAQHNRHRARLEPRAPGFHSGALSFPVGHLLLLNHPLPCVTRQSLGHTFLSMYWLGTSCGIFSCGTGAFKNPILPRVSMGQQHQGHGHVVVASSHLPGSVQHFGQRELGLPGQASC